MLSLSSVFFVCLRMVNIYRHSQSKSLWRSQMREEWVNEWKRFQKNEAMIGWRSEEKKMHLKLKLCHHHHLVVPSAQISLTFSRHPFQSFIASGRIPGLHPMSSQSCCMLVRAGRPAFPRPCEGVHRSISLMSSSLLLQQCAACLVHLTWIVFMMGGRWPYSCCFVGCYLQDLFNMALHKNPARSNIEQVKYYGRAMSSISEGVTRLVRASRMTCKVRRDFKIITNELSRVSRQFHWWHRTFGDLRFVPQNLYVRKQVRRFW